MSLTLHYGQSDYELDEHMAFLHWFMIVFACGGATVWWDVEGEDVRCP